MYLRFRLTFYVGLFLVLLSGTLPAFSQAQGRRAANPAIQTNEGNARQVREQHSYKQLSAQLNSKYHLKNANPQMQPSRPAGQVTVNRNRYKELQQQLMMKYPSLRTHAGQQLPPAGQSLNAPEQKSYTWYSDLYRKKMETLRASRQQASQ